MEDTWAWFFRFLWAVEDVYFGNDGTCSTNWIYLNSIPRIKKFSLLVQNVTGYLNICMKEGVTSRATGTITGSLVFLPNESWWTTVYYLDMYALMWGSRVYSILLTFFIPLITKFVFSCSLFVPNKDHKTKDCEFMTTKISECSRPILLSHQQKKKGCIISSLKCYVVLPLFKDKIGSYTNIAF